VVPCFFVLSIASYSNYGIQRIKIIVTLYLLKTNYKMLQVLIGAKIVPMDTFIVPFCPAVYWVKKISDMHYYKLIQWYQLDQKRELADIEYCYNLKLNGDGKDFSRVFRPTLFSHRLSAANVIGE